MIPLTKEEIATFELKTEQAMFRGLGPKAFWELNGLVNDPQALKEQVTANRAEVLSTLRCALHNGASGRALVAKALTAFATA